MKRTALLLSLSLAFLILTRLGSENSRPLPQPEDRPTTQDASVALGPKVPSQSKMPSQKQAHPAQERPAPSVHPLQNTNPKWDELTQLSPVSPALLTSVGNETYQLYQKASSAQKKVLLNAAVNSKKIAPCLRLDLCGETPESEGAYFDPTNTRMHRAALASARLIHAATLDLILARPSCLRQ